MPRLEEASQRLQVAIDNLEKAVAARAAKDGEGSDLQDALQAAQRENAQLQQLAGTVSTRLDATIGQLRKLVR